MSEKRTFEESIKDLEQVVRDLENKDISLDDAVKKYQAGLRLAKECHKMLEEAEAVVVKEVEAE